MYVDIKINSRNTLYFAAFSMPRPDCFLSFFSSSCSRAHIIANRERGKLNEGFSINEDEANSIQQKIVKAVFYGLTVHPSR